MTNQRSRRRRLIGLVVGAGVLAGLLVVETALRVMGHHDVDGNFFAGWNRLKPYHLPVNYAQELAVAAARPESSSVYDESLGWRRRGDGQKWSGDGIRLDPASPQEPSIEKLPGRLRIALFGDSFTESWVVPYAQSWGNRVHQELELGGVHNEVLNFGCGGYGMDQAYLAWRERGRKYRPDIVIFGLQPENLMRNANLIRLVYQYESGIPFAKPRFVLEPTDELRLINSPPPRPGELSALLGRFDQWPLVSEETFYDPKDYQPRIWYWSMALS